MRYDALLFDLDGTLIDSTRLFYQAIEEEFKLYNLTLNHEQFMAWHGTADHWKDLIVRHGGDDQLEPIMRVGIYERFDTLLKAGVPWLDGVEETINELIRRGMPIGIITNSHDRFIDVLDESIKIKSLFPVIITSDQTQERRKPDPYGLLLAADMLKVNPSKCMYIGDQPFDIMAANGAGMEGCLCPASHTSPSAELMATRVIRSLTELLAIIEDEKN